MSGPDQRDLAQFSAAPFDAVTDLCGDPTTAGLRALFAGNQYMVLPDLVVAQLRQGGLRMGSLELCFTPDIVAASPRALDELLDEALVGPAAIYASNVLALLVRAGNPSQVMGLTDLARPGLRVALPDPATEGIGRLALQALSAAGGDQLHDEVFDAKRRRGETRTHIDPPSSESGVAGRGDDGCGIRLGNRGSPSGRKWSTRPRTVPPLRVSSTTSRDQQGRPFTAGMASALRVNDPLLSS
ncbi:MAG TPA: substrate-binding domain-containing protein [Candidatus Nanopelagicaceae bacterium]|nr:substrate-binding domain-containing protein [Candidatus Nanopelagicaceae bacterium]